MTKDGRYHELKMVKVIAGGCDGLYQYSESLIHKEDGPAWIHHDDSWWYFTNGRIDRKDGPAEWDQDNPGNKYAWYINGIRFTDEKSYQEKSGLTDEEMTLMILKYGNIE